MLQISSGNWGGLNSTNVQKLWLRTKLRKQASSICIAVTWRGKFRAVKMQRMTPKKEIAIKVQNCLNGLTGFSRRVSEVVCVFQGCVCVSILRKWNCFTDSGIWWSSLESLFMHFTVILQHSEASVHKWFFSFCNFWVLVFSPFHPFP